MTTKTLTLLTTTLVLNTGAFANIVTLKKITVHTASKTIQNAEELTSHVDVITAEDIEDRGFSTVTQALNSLAGISFTQNGGLGMATSLRLRGMDSKRTLVLIDGIRYNDVTSISGADFSNLMIEDIAQIEVVKGAQSGIWGADASAGVINIITKKPEAGMLHGEVHAESGSFKTRKYGTTLSSAGQYYDFKISHNEVKSDGFSAQATKDVDLDTFEDDAYENKSTHIQLGFNINETNNIKLTHNIINAEADYDTFANPNAEAFSKTKDSFSAIHFNHVDSFNIFDLYAKHSKFDREFFAPDFMGAVKKTEFDGTAEEYGFTSKIAIAKENFILIGADYKKREHANIVDNSIDKDLTSKGIFITSNHPIYGFLNGKTILSKSIRYDKYDEFDSKYTYKLGIKYLPKGIKGLNTTINYGTAYTVPTLFQSYSVYGNTDLIPESTTSFDVGIQYKNLSFNYFNTKIEDMIDFDMATYKYTNIADTSRIAGLEIDYEKMFLDSVLFSFHYTRLLKAEDSQGMDLLRRVKESFKLSLDYYAIKDFHIGIDAQYIGSRDDIAYHPDFSTSKVQTGKYTCINLNADYKLTKDIKIYANVENLTDKSYQTVHGYASSPRAFRLGLKAKF